MAAILTENGVYDRYARNAAKLSPFTAPIIRTRGAMSALALLQPSPEAAMSDPLAAAEFEERASHGFHVAGKTKPECAYTMHYADPDCVAYRDPNCPVHGQAAK